VSDEHPLLSDALPKRRIEDAIPHLTRPFHPDAVKFKVQVGKEGATSAMIVAHLDARLVIARLNAVHPWWDAEYRALTTKGDVQECTLQLGGTHRSDVGDGGDWKSARSDSLKRAAVHYGVGSSLYATKRIWLRVGTEERELRTDSKQRPLVDERTEAWLRRGYAGWVIRADVVAQFGPVLSHGEEPGHTGIEETGTPPVEGPTPQEQAEHIETLEQAQLDSDIAVALMNDVNDMYRVLRELDPGKFPPGWHKQNLLQCKTEADLRLYMRTLETRIAGEKE
jgi:hypothetical protein